MEMLLVKSVDVCIVPDRETAMLSCDGPRNYVPVDRGASSVTFEAYRELVRGREFVNRNGQRVCIGMAKQASEILGLEYEAWENMEKALWEARAEREGMRLERDEAVGKMAYVSTASFWTRLKWLFCGVTA